MTSSLDYSMGDTITIDLSSITNVAAAQPSIYTIDMSNSSVTLTNTNDVPFGHPSGLWKPPVPFTDGFPEWNDFQDMCKEYPGLEKAYEHLKSYYNMCKDDWESKKKE